MPEKEQFSKEELKRRLDGNELDLSLCSIVKVPVKQISSFPVVKIIDLSCNKISEVPESFCELINLTQIDLSKNCLVSLPPNFGKLKNLKRLDLYSNNLVSLPLSFSELKLLKWLDLKDNPVQADLFDVVGDCLEPKDCENCAIKMLNFVRMMKAEDDKRKAKEAEIERVKKLKEASELEQQNELRKRAKLQEKEKRRQAFIEKQKDKQISSHQDGKDFDEKQHVKEKQSSALNKDETSSSSILMTLMTVFFVSLFIVLVFYFSAEYYRSIKPQGK